MRSFCFEIIYGILLIVQKGHSTPDGQRVALNVRPLQPKRFFLAKPAVQTEGAEYAGAWFYDYTHQNIDLIGKQSLFLFRFSVRGDFDTLSRIINNQMIQTCFLKKLAHSQKNFTLQAFRSGCNAGHLTKDEARELLGMEPCKTGGDCFKITISDMFIGSNDDPAEVTTDLMQESTDEVEVTDDEDTGGMLFMSDHREHEEKSRTQNIGNLLAAAQKAQRAKFEVATMKFFRQQQKRLSGALSGTEKADWSVWDVLMPYITENHVEDSAAWSALGEQEQKNLVEQFIGGLVNWPSEETAMEEIFKPLWKQTYDEGTRIAKQAYNIRGVDRPELLSQAKLHGGQRVRHVTQTTKENISRIVANGIEAGIGREKMADEILQEYEIQTRSRARLIADQETVMTLETGHYDMMQKSGATTKTWHHRPQKNPRDGSDGGPNHVKMDGETVPIDARFSNGLRYPCDPEGPARETIKCRCYVTYNR